MPDLCFVYQGQHVNTCTPNTYHPLRHTLESYIGSVTLVMQLYTLQALVGSSGSWSLTPPTAPGWHPVRLTTIGFLFAVPLIPVHDT